MNLSLKIRNIFFYCVSLMLLSNCVGGRDKAQKTSGIIATLDKKIENGTITFDDVYYNNYGEYADLTDENADILRGLAGKIKKYENGETRSSGNLVKINVEKIINDNLDKLVRIMANKDNLKYGIYGTTKEVWLAKDTFARSPLNYFQTYFLYEASGDTLDKLSCEILKYMLVDEKPHETNPGIFWILYGKGNGLVNAFAILKGHINYCDKKTKKGQVLTKQEEKELFEIIAMGETKKLKTEGIIEYFAKKELVSKVEELLKGTDKIVDRNNKLKAKMLSGSKK